MSRLSTVMMRALMLHGSLSHVLSCRTGICPVAGRRALSWQPPPAAGQTTARQRLPESSTPQITPVVRYSDVPAEKYTMIYTLPHIKLLRAVSRLKLLQTGLTGLILPPVYVLYLQGSVPFFLVSYSTGIALFAGTMLYVASHFLRRVVGMMYLDSGESTLRVSHLTFWGRRSEIYLPVTDVMTIADTGDMLNEKILKLKRYSSPDTLYFSTHFGRVVDRQKFERVFGSLK